MLFRSILRYRVRRPAQPDDDDAPDSAEFEDWIDKLHGFIHIINDVTSYRPRSSQVSTFVNSSSPALTEDSQNFSGEENESDPHFTSAETYDAVPRSDAAKADDKRIELVRKWHADLQRPSHMSNAEYATFMRYCVEFFLDAHNLWRKDSQGAHKIVVSINRRFEIMREMHDDVGHKGFHATRAHILLRFWWPHMQPDILWFVRSCLPCQKRQLRQVLIPPIVATPAPLFAKIYVDTMHMPP